MEQRRPGNYDDQFMAVLAVCRDLKLIALTCSIVRGEEGVDQSQHLH